MEQNDPRNGERSQTVNIRAVRNDGDVKRLLIRLLVQFGASYLRC